MIVPFAFGFGLGWVMPDRYVAAPEHRTLFAAFLATAMSISAMPVIAKILLDLDLTRRNIGVVILSAGVVDDTTGWLILSLIAGVATTGNADLGAWGNGLFVVCWAPILSSRSASPPIASCRTPTLC
jgi:Kef-type K+ transport system membrane component KefB